MNKNYFLLFGLFGFLIILGLFGIALSDRAEATNVPVSRQPLSQQSIAPVTPAPYGLSAIKPHINLDVSATITNVATFTEADIRQHYKDHLVAAGQLQQKDLPVVEKVEFTTYGKATDQVGAVSGIISKHIGISDDMLVCLVTLSGDFALASGGGPPLPGDNPKAKITSTLIHQHVYEMYDAHTGNLLSSSSGR